MRAILACVAVAGLCASASADKTRADQLFDDGRRYLAKHEFALACTAFEQSQQADPAIGTELNIALCYEQWGHVAAAYRAYVEAERLAKLRFDARAQGARKKIDELKAQIIAGKIQVPDYYKKK